jgi:hypothetical protein
MNEWMSGRSGSIPNAPHPDLEPGDALTCWAISMELLGPRRSSFSGEGNARKAETSAGGEEDSTGPGSWETGNKGALKILNPRLLDPAMLQEYPPFTLAVKGLGLELMLPLCGSPLKVGFCCWWCWLTPGPGAFEVQDKLPLWDSKWIFAMSCNAPKNDKREAHGS